VAARIVRHVALQLLLLAFELGHGEVESRLGRVQLAAQLGDRSLEVGATLTRRSRER
jgi:hypothetical protein